MQKEFVKLKFYIGLAHKLHTVKVEIVKISHMTNDNELVKRKKKMTTQPGPLNYAKKDSGP